MLTCIVNISEGASRDTLRAIALAAGESLVDQHADSFHNRSVFSLAGAWVNDAVRALTKEALARIDFAEHDGVHPRLGVVDVVPFVPLEAYRREAHVSFDEALAARADFARFAAERCGLPCFFYGPERSLPELRRRAFRDLAPDAGPPVADVHKGACCVGARAVLVAYNCYLDGASLDEGRAIAKSLRSPALRTLAFDIDGVTQISCNCVAPFEVGPDQVYDAIAAQASIASCELVGLIPRDVLIAIPKGRWAELGLSEDATLEERMKR